MCMFMEIGNIMEGLFKLGYNILPTGYKLKRSYNIIIIIVSTQHFWNAISFSVVYNFDANNLTVWRVQYFDPRM